MQHSLPQAFLWDLDGSLLESEHLWFEAEVATMAAYGATWTAEDQRYCLGGPLERVANYMADKVEVASSEVIGASLLVNIEHLMATTPARWCPGVIPLLQEIIAADIPMALVTASHRRLVNALDHALEHTLQNVLEVDSSVFAVTVAGDEVDHSKPHPDPYLKAAALLGVPIDKCVVIEDSPTGIASAISSGAFVVAVPSLCDPPTIVWGMSVSSLEQVSIALIQERRHEGKVETDEWRLPTRPVHTHIDNTH